jgi:plasmid stabilization system protein ParE
VITVRLSKDAANYLRRAADYLRKLNPAAARIFSLAIIVSIHDPIANLFHIPRHDIPSNHRRELRAAAMRMWNEIAQLALA